VEEGLKRIYLESGVVAAENPDVEVASTAKRENPELEAPGWEHPLASQKRH
jgi:hypothetical protein